MTIEQFRLLNELEKVSAILEYGKLMAQNTENENRIFLYRMESFYVAASYGASDDLLTEITCYLDVDQAVPHFRKQFISINPAEREYTLPEI